MIQKMIAERIEFLEGNIGIFYKDLTSGFTCQVGNTSTFKAAGIAKLLLLVEVLRQINSGELSADEVYHLKETDKAPSIGAINSLHSGIPLLIKDLYQLMITVSDNTAFNVLVKRVGIKAINDTLKNLGYSVSRVRRLFFDLEASQAGIENTIDISEIADLLERMHQGQLIHREVSQNLRFLLAQHQRDYILPYHFTEMVEIAHQMGEDDAIRHDCGIVYAKRPFILCMCSENIVSRDIEGAMRDIALMCLKYSIKIN